LKKNKLKYIQESENIKICKKDNIRIRRKDLKTEKFTHSQKKKKFYTKKLSDFMQESEGYKSSCF